MTLLADSRRVGTLVGLFLLGALLSYLSPFFLTTSNLLNVMEQTAINAVIAVGMTFVILSAGIDLSVGSIAALSGVVMANRLLAGWPLGAAILAGVLTGALCGGFSGLLITRGKLPPFIATLGMMSVARGAALLFTDGRPISGFDESLRWLSTGRILGVPVPVLLTIFLYVLAIVLLNRTRFGRYVYAIGGNEEAARLSGVAVGFHKTLVYVISGVTAALGAVLLTARLNSAQPIAGMMYELDAIAAVVIGGTSLTGGLGTLGGTLIGALTMGVLRNGLNLLGISSFLQQIVIGLVIIAAVLMDSLVKSKRS
ncbi:MAG: ribose ABC transporter permease [Vicinamibacteria bacterium]|nr:ribose ABC transporter permease [Vicinamibacteria bacterium]